MLIVPDLFSLDVGVGSPFQPKTKILKNLLWHILPIEVLGTG